MLFRGCSQIIIEVCEHPHKEDPFPNIHIHMGRLKALSEKQKCFDYIRTNSANFSRHL
mgnify:CR=1 FL=1